MTRNNRSTEGCLLAATVLLLYPVMLHAWEITQELPIIQSDSRSLTIEYRPLHDVPRLVSASPQSNQIFDFVGSVSPDARTSEGNPDLQFRRFLLFVPAKAGNGIRLVSADYKGISNVPLASASGPTKPFGSASVPATGTWYRLSVNQEGIYDLSSQVLESAGIDLAGIDPRTIKIYSNGGTEVAEDITRSRPIDLVEIAVQVEGEEDGQLIQQTMCSSTVKA